MDLSKLNSNEKMAAIGAVVAILGSIVSFGAGPYGLLTGIAMLVIIFLPQLSPATSLPGSKGSLMLIVGGAAAVGAVLTLLTWLPYLGIIGGYFIGGLFGIVGGLLMGWASWQEFQAEGGKFQLGAAPSTTPPPAPSATETSADRGAEPPVVATPPEPPRDVYEAPAAPAASAPPSSYEAPGAPADKDPEDRRTP